MFPLKNLARKGLSCYLGYKYESHGQEATQENGHGHKCKTGVLVGANDQCHWGGDDAQHLKNSNDNKFFLTFWKCDKFDKYWFKEWLVPQSRLQWLP